MRWQDLMFTLLQFVFIVALLPSIFSGKKPAPLTCILNGGALILMAMTFASLAFWSSTALYFVMGLLWLWLYYQQRDLPIATNYDLTGAKHEASAVMQVIATDFYLLDQKLAARATADAEAVRQRLALAIDRLRAHTLAGAIPTAAEGSGAQGQSSKPGA